MFVSPEPRERPRSAADESGLSRPVVVAGAGGFIGGHLVRALLDAGREVRAVDVKPAEEWHQRLPGALNLRLDLRERDACARALRGAGEVYNLAADMGGIGYITENRAACMLSVLIHAQLLEAARRESLDRYFFASSACVYPTTLQERPEVEGLAEDDAYPALPEDGYGWEKLYGERLCRAFLDDYGLQTRVARYHNVYGPFGTWEGGREKAPAAICRKVAEAVVSGRHEIEIWGDGQQTRSFLWVGDAVDGTLRLTTSDEPGPLNIGSEERVTIDELVSLVEDIAGVRLQRRYRLDAAVGVRGRNSDNTRARERLGWSPATSLREGLERTWAWIFDEVRARAGRAAAPMVSVAAPAPDLSVVVASRNDAHGGDIAKRMRIFVRGLLHQARRTGLRAELIFVEWNPPPDAPRLHELLPRPEPGDPLRLRTVTVPARVHDRYRHGDAIPLFQMIAKNVGIRRARAERVLCTNVDLLFSDPLADFLAAGPFDPGCVYRANRCDVPDQFDPDADVAALLASCEASVLRRLGHAGHRDPRFERILFPRPPSPNWRYALFLRGVDLLLRGGAAVNAAAEFVAQEALGTAPEHRGHAPQGPPTAWHTPTSPGEIAFGALDTDACGDFMLMSKAAWLDIQGHAELDLYSIHLDSLALGSAVARGFRQVVLAPEQCTYHLDHPSGWMTLAGVEKLRFLERRPALDYSTMREIVLDLLQSGRRLDLNAPDWGLAGEALEEHQW